MAWCLVYLGLIVFNAIPATTRGFYSFVIHSLPVITLTSWTNFRFELFTRILLVLELLPSEEYVINLLALSLKNVLITARLPAQQRCTFLISFDITFTTMLVYKTLVFFTYLDIEITCNNQKFWPFDSWDAVEKQFMKGIFFQLCIAWLGSINTCDIYHQTFSESPDI